MDDIAFDRALSLAVRKYIHESEAMLDPMHFAKGAHFGREFSRREVIDSPEIKGLVEAMKHYKEMHYDENGIHDKHHNFADKALAAFQKRFGK